MAGRPIRAGIGDEKGFAIVEVLVGMGIFAIIAIGFAGTMAGALRTQITTRARTTATQLATQQVEEVRSLAYDQVGTVGGNPSGTLPAERTETVDTSEFVVRTVVEYVDDPVPSAFRTYANYKRLTVVVADPDSGASLARMRTIIAPPTQPSLTRAVVQAKVTELDKITALAGVGIRISGGPSGAQQGSTDDAGEATFAALLPTDGGLPYEIEVTGLPAGWTIVPEDLLPANAETQALATQTVVVRLRAYRVASFDVQLTSGGAPFVGPASVTISSDDWGSETFAVAGGQLAVSSVAGRTVMSGADYDVTATAGFLSGSAQASPSPAFPTADVVVDLEVAP